MLAAGKSKAAESFQTLAQIVSRREIAALPASKTKGSSLFGKLFKR